MGKKREDMTAEELEACKKRGKSARNRGKVGEREIAHILQEYGFKGERGVQYNGSTGQPDVKGMDFVHIEVKRVEKLNLHDAIKQSKGDRRKGEIPIVVHRRNNEPWYCTMEFRTFMDIWSQLPQEARMLVSDKYEFKETSKCKETKSSAHSAKKSGKSNT